jgi:hypothetical protein
MSAEWRQSREKREVGGDLMDPMDGMDRSGRDGSVWTGWAWEADRLVYAPAVKPLSAWWWVGVPVALALLVNEQAMLAIVAIVVGGRSVPEALRDAAGERALFAFLFFTPFRLVPYLLLVGICWWLSCGRGRRFLVPVLVGGCIGIVAFIVVASWQVLRPLYTDERVSSTAPLAFLFIPTCAAATGALGAALAAGIQAILQRRPAAPVA